MIVADLPLASPPPPSPPHVGVGEASLASLGRGLASLGEGCFPPPRGEGEGGGPGLTPRRRGRA